MRAKRPNRLRPFKMPFYRLSDSIITNSGCQFGTFYAILVRRLSGPNKYCKLTENRIGSRTYEVKSKMTQDKNDPNDATRTRLKLDALPGQIRETVQDFSGRVLQTLRDNLQSITVVGSSLTADFKPGRSDINTVLVLGKQTIETLNAIALLAKPMSKKKISPPLLMTLSYIERSSDVFGMEFLDFQLSHQTVLGEDPFASLTFEKKDVRLQCERELKATLIRLRQGYIAAAANRRLVRDILISTAKALAPLLRAMLWLKDIERVGETRPTFSKASGEFSVKTDSLMTADQWRHEKVRLSETEVESTFESIYSTIDKLAGLVDKLEV